MDFSHGLSHEPGKLLLAAHRGISGANIPCNTLAAYGIALSEGADIVELDVSRSRDGVLFAFHPGMERAHLNTRRRIAARSASSVRKLRFVNQDNVKTHYPVNTLEEAFRFLKGKCFINVDKFWTCPEEITKVIRSCGVEEQVIIKTPAKQQHFDSVERLAPDLMFMPVISEEDTVTPSLLARKLRLVGAEVLFSSDASPVVSPDYIAFMHESGLMLWGNAIVYNERANISAGHTDDLALTSDPGKGWGWFREKGFDILQTDWVQMAAAYLNNPNSSAV